MVTGEHHPRSWHNGNYWKSAGHIRFDVMRTTEKVIKYLEPKMAEEDEEMRTAWMADNLQYRLGICQKKLPRTNFQAKEFYTLKTHKSRLFSPLMNSENA